MDLHDYLVDGVVHATAPRNETEAAARDRREAIIAMLWAFQAADAMEAMIACHCVTLHFLANAAMHDAADSNLEPAVLIRARAGAMSISRTYGQWIGKFQALKKRNETRAAEAREAAKAREAAVAGADAVAGATAMPGTQAVAAAVPGAAAVAAAVPGAAAVAATSAAQALPGAPAARPPQPGPSPAARPVIQAMPNGPTADKIAVPGNGQTSAAIGSPSKTSGQASAVHRNDRT